MAGSVLPALLLHVGGGGAYYFLNIGTWIAIASLSARLMGAWKNRPAFVLTGLGICAFAACAMASGEARHAYSAMKTMRQNLIAQAGPQAAAPFAHVHLFSGAALAAARKASAQSTGARMGDLLRQAGAAPGADMAVFVAPDLRPFWSLTPACNMAPFIVPASFGLPLLEGVPPTAEKCDLGFFYGYHFYGPDARSRQTPDAQLCRRALAKGFHHVAVLQDFRSARRLDCAAMIGAR
jgi:hypothetical protein